MKKYYYLRCPLKVKYKLTIFLFVTYSVNIVKDCFQVLTVQTDMSN